MAGAEQRRERRAPSTPSGSTPAGDLGDRRVVTRLRHGAEQRAPTVMNLRRPESASWRCTSLRDVRRIDRGDDAARVSHAVKQGDGELRAVGAMRPRHRPVRAARHEPAGQRPDRLGEVGVGTRGPWGRRPAPVCPGARRPRPCTKSGDGRLGRGDGRRGLGNTMAVSVGGRVDARKRERHRTPWRDGRLNGPSGPTALAITQAMPLP